MPSNAQRHVIGPFFSLGSLLSRGRLYHYAAGTSTDKTVWTDRSKTTTAAQPLLSDSNGLFTGFFDGLYKIIITDSDDTSIAEFDHWGMNAAYTTTFTPTLTFGGSSTGMAGTFTGTYLTVGDLCYVTMRILLTAKGTAEGVAKIGNLPLTSATLTYPGHVQCTYSNMGNLTSNLIGYVESNATTIQLADSWETQTGTIEEGSLTDTTDLQVSGWYVVA